jgi:hypothetical protein
MKELRIEKIVFCYMKNDSVDIEVCCMNCSNYKGFGKFGKNDTIICDFDEKQK